MREMIWPDVAWDTHEAELAAELERVRVTQEEAAWAAR